MRRLWLMGLSRRYQFIREGNQLKERKGKLRRMHFYGIVKRGNANSEEEMLVHWEQRVHFGVEPTGFWPRGE